MSKSNSKTFIIAEAGVNHNGDINIAKKMIDLAADAGADAVKFQTFKAENIVSISAPKAKYQERTSSSSESHLEMLKRLELTSDIHEELIEFCKKRKILFMSSPFDLESIDLLNNFGLDIFKIPSGEITNLPYLQKIGGLKKKIIVSSGMAELEEIKSALEVLVGAGTLKENIIVLHCNTDYPTSFDDVNLLSMITIKNSLDVKVGYSDHTSGIQVPIAAVALGAEVIEKHFTLDKNMEGPDHKASLNPQELKDMVLAIRNIEKALGDKIKKPSKSELKNINVVRKSIIAASNIKKGEKFTEENITIKRPGTGISPMSWDDVIGKVAIRDFWEDEIIEI